MYLKSKLPRIFARVCLGKKSVFESYYYSKVRASGPLRRRLVGFPPPAGILCTSCWGRSWRAVNFSGSLRSGSSSVGFS